VDPISKASMGQKKVKKKNGPEFVGEGRGRKYNFFHSPYTPVIEGLGGLTEVQGVHRHR